MFAAHAAEERLDPMEFGVARIQGCAQAFGEHGEVIGGRGSVLGELLANHI